MRQEAFGAEAERGETARGIERMKANQECGEAENFAMRVGALKARCSTQRPAQSFEDGDDAARDRTVEAGRQALRREEPACEA